MLDSGLQRHSRTGFALVMALVMLSVFAVLSVVFATSTDLNLQMSHNLGVASDARLAAESGLAWCVYVVESVAVPDSATGQEVLDSLAAALATRLNGSANLQGHSVGYDGSTIVLPAIAIDNGGSFDAEITVAAGKVLLLRVFGRAPAAGAAGGVIERSLSVQVESGDGDAFGYGVFARGPVTVGQNLSYFGANDSSEASVFSAASGVAVTVDSGTIEGDVITFHPDATVDVGATVGGSTYRSDTLPAPRIDPVVFEPFATNIVDAGTDTSTGTFTNIRVVAGTNPSFGNNVVIQGVMYIEAPNNVSFTNNVAITGVIVSEDPGPDAAPEDHCVYFKNNLSVEGLDQLPDTEGFATLRAMGGSAFLLPGFTLEFKNNFTSVSGTIAAERIIAKNNLVGTVYGSIIVLGDEGLTLNNSSAITIDRSRYSGPAPGITGGDQKLAAQFSSYCEH